jgi:hypothetical protein
MTPEKWEQVGGLCRAALDLHPDERASFLNEACGDNKSLRHEVNSLLAAEGSAGDFLCAGAVKDAAKTLSGAGEQASSLEHTYAVSDFVAGVRALAQQRLEKLNDRLKHSEYVPAVESRPLTCA